MKFIVRNGQTYVRHWGRWYWLMVATMVKIHKEEENNE